MVGWLIMSGGEEKSVELCGLLEINNILFGKTRGYNDIVLQTFIDIKLFNVITRWNTKMPMILYLNCNDFAMEIKKVAWV